MIALNIAETRRALRLMRGAYPKRYGVQPCLSLVNHGGASALRAVDPCGIEITMALPLSQIVSGRDEIHDIPFFALGAMLRPKADSPDVEIAAPEAGRVSMGVDGMLASFIVRKTEDVASLFEYSRKLREPGEPCPSLTIGAKPLAKALALCARSMSVEETRYYLNGVYLSPHPTDDTAVVFVSNDGHRMIKHALAGVKHDLAEGMIIPRETVAALQTLLAAFPEDTLDLVRVGPTQLLARGPNLMLRTP
ncbi:hypothetical protein GT370_07400 [Acidocella sp. MX-AZ03]|nr:hypothetical protein [Acidocella sp. MX-AZ03]WBO60589.1 hypothetical protein GT370_07400 [Acidocella sp. MX-AZ03]